MSLFDKEKKKKPTESINNPQTTALYDQIDHLTNTNKQLQKQL